jgi:hypothetical protein
LFLSLSIYILLSISRPNSTPIKTTGKLLANNKLERRWKEVIVVYSEKASQFSPVGT